eukprot:gb/GECH01009294.1/.p1 GENE.gb/GECH01009294.1/~~gb/GECH01009294.1/.p1  ORF type:complete len:194 (+),score=39.02 gb/GECH01009294.1/:1-582(+)
MKSNVKCVVVGDGAVGKTSLLWVYARGKFPKEYVPTIFDNWSTTVFVNEQKVTLGLWDTAGHEEYARLRPLSYQETDIFVICFSVVEPSSYHNVKNKWHPEVAHYAQNTPILLVGTKQDLREDESIVQDLHSRDEKPITYIQGEKLRKDIEARRYMECSAKEGKGVKEVFDEALRNGLFKKAPQKRAALCVVL